MRFSKIFMLFTGLLLTCAQALLAATVTGVIPNRGPVTGGTLVTITGTGFSTETMVNFGSIPVTITDINKTDTSFTVLTPNAVPSTVDIYVGATAPAAFLANGQFTFQGNWKGYVGDTQGHLFTFDVNDPAGISSTSIANGALNFIAITPDGRFAYVANGDRNNSIPIVNLINNSIFASPIVAADSTGAAITPDGKYAFVGTSRNLHVISVSDPTKIDTNAINGFPITSNIGLSPHVAVSPDGQFVYTSGSLPPTNCGYSVFKPLDPSPFVVGNNFSNSELVSQSLSITPDGRFVYAGAKSSSSDGSVHLIDTSNNLEVSSASPQIPIPTLGASVLNSPWIAATPNGKFVYATQGLAQSIAKIDTTTNLFSTIPLGLDTNRIGPVAIAVTPDSLMAFAVDYNNRKLIPISALTDSSEPGIALPAGGAPLCIAISPDPAPAANFTPTPGSSATEISFDASLSATAVGTIVSYIWDFGDGSPVVTATSPAPITHVFPGNGTYNVTLTVINSAGTSTKQVFTGQTMSQAGSSRAQITKSVVIGSNSPNVPTVVPAPKKFCGKITQRHNGKFDLKAEFDKSASQNIAYYEVYADNKLVARIPTTSKSKFSKHLDTRGFYQHHVRKYVRYLDKKYKVRSVSTSGEKSDFVNLDVKKVKK